MPFASRFFQYRLVKALIDGDTDFLSRIDDPDYGWVSFSLTESLANRDIDIDEIEERNPLILTGVELVDKLKKFMKTVAERIGIDLDDNFLVFVAPKRIVDPTDISLGGEAYRVWIGALLDPEEATRTIVWDTIDIARFGSRFSIDIPENIEEIVEEKLPELVKIYEERVLPVAKRFHDELLGFLEENRERNPYYEKLYKELKGIENRVTIDN